MGWEERNGRRYYYRKRREGDRVLSEYIGVGDLADLIAAIDAQDQAEREHKRELIRAEIEADRAIVAEVDVLGDLVRAVTHAALLLSGHHTHKGQWRQKRD